MFSLAIILLIIAIGFTVVALHPDEAETSAGLLFIACVLYFATSLIFITIINTKKDVIESQNKSIVKNLEKPPCATLEDLENMWDKGYKKGLKEGFEKGEKEVYKSLLGIDTLDVKF